jgi:uncharacterized protein
MSNRLARESSPYLRQHADNPVDWYPWGTEALERAEADDLPILLSIGYSACHWCHVMERESFEDPAVAAIMNEGFVNVKVDREERPDIDTVYMRAVQALTGHGGWPLTAFLTPAGEPFYGGTYFPPEPRQGMPSFRQVLEAARRAWSDRRDDVVEAAGEITRTLEAANRGPGGIPGPPGTGEPGPDLAPELTRGAVSTLMRSLDPSHGGFGGAPKFPQPVVHEFLLGHAVLTGDRTAAQAALHSLGSMARGGIRDHLGGGFHRYSVDARWLVPHFEKMLYDNALLATAFVRGWQVSGREEFRRVAREVLDYLLDDLQAPGGGFFAARDADSEGEEGVYYLWTRAQVEELLDRDDAALFCRCYDISGSGNFEGRNILHTPHDLDAIARDEGVTPDELRDRLAASRAVLLRARAEREHPLRDSKVLAGWSGLALRALAEAGRVLDEPRYLETARDGMSGLLPALRPEGRLLHQIPSGESAHIPAFLDDVGALGNALVSLHEATLEQEWLDEAESLLELIDRYHVDSGSGVMYDAPSDQAPLVVRPREVTDNPAPSGHALTAELCLRLGRILERDELEARARQLVAAEAAGLLRFPSAFGRLLSVADQLVHPDERIVIQPAEGSAADGSGTGVAELLTAAHARFRPGRVVCGTAPGGPVTTAQLCRDGVCRLPVDSPHRLARELDPDRYDRADGTSTPD